MSPGDVFNFLSPKHPFSYLKYPTSSGPPPAVGSEQELKGWNPNNWKANARIHRVHSFGCSITSSLSRFK